MVYVDITGEGHQLLIDFKAYKEKLLHEELVITDSNDPAKTLTLVFHARVLGMSTIFICLLDCQNVQLFKYTHVYVCLLICACS